MEIILEGPDNAGKSTLAKMISEAIGRAVISSEGREKYPGEIVERIVRYSRDHQGVIFDRHPVVSQTIYSLVKSNTPVPEELIKEFYTGKNFFIYCRSNLERGLEGHVVKEHDDEEYLARIQNSLGPLLEAYDKWALQHANYIYRIGDNITHLINLVERL